MRLLVTRRLGASSSVKEAQSPTFRLSTVPGSLQAKRPYDNGGPYEREADQVADRISRMHEAGIRTMEARPFLSEPDPVRVRDSGSSSKGRGEPLPDSVRSYFEPRFGHDFSHVRVHVGSAAFQSATAMGAAAYTTGTDIVFGLGRYDPHSTAGRSLLAHELAHVVQQGAPPFHQPSARVSASSARDGPASAATGGHAVLPVGTIQCSPLSDELTSLAREPKGRVFDILRQRGPASGDSEALQVLRARFAGGTDDRWLAEQLLAHGPEPLWPHSLITERVTRASRGNWSPEAGNIRAELPYPAEAHAGSIPPVVAYFFPGSTAERALVVGGIHGNEVQGARTVESLRAELRTLSAAGRPPRFTTILVPVLNARIHDPTLRQQRRRYLPRRSEEQASDPGTRARETSPEIEPNRTFPAPGESYADVRARAGRGGTELEFTGPRRDRALSTTVMPPETRVLVQLIERFRPSRIASVHAHSIGTGGARPGNDPGIFVDPAIRRDASGNLRTDTDRFDPTGDSLARRMIASGRLKLGALPREVRTGRASPFRGNTGSTPTRYATSVATQEGYSLGDWAPSHGIQTITVEIPQYGRLGSAVPAAARTAVEELHRDILLEEFLEVPPAGP
jgi:hypothetical protein